MSQAPFHIRDDLLRKYPDVYSSVAKVALACLADHNTERLSLMAQRTKRRKQRHQNGHRITFLDPNDLIPGTQLTVSDARAGKFAGADIPPDLQRQWIQGTGPAAKPRASLQSSLRNVAYALLSGADGWMFDGEDALGQIDTMSLDNQRNLKLAYARDPVFLAAAERVAATRPAPSCCGPGSAAARS